MQFQFFFRLRLFADVWRQVKYIITAGTFVLIACSCGCVSTPVSAPNAYAENEEKSLSIEETAEGYLFDRYPMLAVSADKVPWALSPFWLAGQAHFEALTEDVISEMLRIDTSQAAVEGIDTTPLALNIHFSFDEVFTVVPDAVPAVFIVGVDKVFTIRVDVSHSVENGVVKITSRSRRVAVTYAAIIAIPFMPFLYPSFERDYVARTLLQRAVSSHMKEYFSPS